MGRFDSKMVVVHHNDEVACLLCRRTVAYRRGDSSNFETHMRKEHAATFDLDLVLATCFMEQEEKDAVKRVMNEKLEDAYEQLVVIDEDSSTEAVNKVSYNDLFSCTKCAKSYRWKKSLRHHERTEHEGSYTPNDDNEIHNPALEEIKKDETIEEEVDYVNIYDCTKCDKKYGLKDSLRKHIKLKHSETSNPNELTLEESIKSEVSDEIVIDDDMDLDYTQDDSTHSALDGKIFNSKYFKRKPVIKRLQRQSLLKEFKDDDTMFPSGWKYRIIDVVSNGYRNGVRQRKIFLTPDFKTIHSGLGVIEYLRLEDKLDQDQLWKLAQHLGINRKMFLNLWE